MIVAVLFMIARKWNVSRCSTTEEWIMEVYKIEFYSVVDKNEIYR